MSVLVTAAFLLTGFSLIGGPLRRAADPERILVPVPTKITKKEIYVRRNIVSYNVYTHNSIYIDFQASHDAVLSSIRIIIEDHTVYKLDIQRDVAGKIRLTEENGEYIENTVKIDRAKWLKFFEEKIVMPAFVYSPN